MQAKLQLFASSQTQPAKNPYENKTDSELAKVHSKFSHGCGAIYHEPGYMNSLGTAPYDFTCDSSHNCHKCRAEVQQISSVIYRRAAVKEQIAKKARSEKQYAVTKSQYFKQCPHCFPDQCKLCEACFLVVQARVTELQTGCGAEWIQQFGGMAAGPATVTCKDNYFLCGSCSRQLHYIKEVLKTQFPLTQIKHIPQGVKQFWCPSATSSW